MATPENEAAPSPMTMYALLAAQPLTNWVIRGAIAPLMQFIVADLSFNPTQKALLLGAFYPGYLVTQVPSGFLIQKYGAKLMLTVNMVGTALATAALPLALSSARPITATWVALTISGMFQGSLIPGHQEMKRNWLPAGAGKAFANRIIGLSLCVHSLLATSLTPFLATRFGWKSVLYAYSAITIAFAATWNSIATDHRAKGQLSALTSSTGPTKKGSAAKEVQATTHTPTTKGHEAVKSTGTKTFEWRIFTVPAVLVTMGCKATSGLPEYCITQWLPSEFAKRFGSTDTEIAMHRIWVAPLMIATDWAVGGLEEILIRRNWPLLTIRRRFSVVGGALELIGLCGFVLARSPGLAAAFNAMVCAAYTLHHSGWSVNQLEVGGQDTAVMNAFSNIFNNAPGFFIPPLGLFIQSMTGSVALLFVSCGSINWLMTILFAKYCSLEPARQTLARLDAQRKGKGEGEEGTWLD